MGIIIGIRKFLKLENALTKFDKNIIDAAGLIIEEKKDFMTRPIIGSSCFGPIYMSFNPKHDMHACFYLHGHTDFHTDAVFHF